MWSSLLKFRVQMPFVKFVRPSGDRGDVDWNQTCLDNRAWKRVIVPRLLFCEWKVGVHLSKRCGNCISHSKHPISSLFRKAPLRNIQWHSYRFAERWEMRFAFSSCVGSWVLRLSKLWPADGWRFGALLDREDGVEGWGETKKSFKKFWRPPRTADRPFGGQGRASIARWRSLRRGKTLSTYRDHP